MKKNHPILLAGATVALLGSNRAFGQAPVITGFAPLRNTMSAAVNGQLDLTFSQPVTGAGNIRTFGSRYRGLHSGTGSGDGTSQLRFSATRSWGLGELVSVTVPASVRSAAAGGAALPGAVYQFRTAMNAGVYTNYYAGTGSLPEVGTDLRDPTLADVNGDGELDLLLADTQNDRVRLRLSSRTSPNYFDAATLLNTGEQPGSIAVADMNNDGKLDLLTSSNGATLRMVSVALGNGQGGFGTPLAVPLAAAPGRVQVGDVNADGNLDFVVPVLVPYTTPVGPASTVLAVRLGNGQGGFTAAPDVPLDLSTNSPNLHLADFNNDGQLDCLVGSTSNNLVKTYLGNGQGGFALATNAPLALTGPTDVADVTGDGVLDVAMADGPGNVVRLYPGTGQGGFGAPTVLYIPHPTSVLLSGVAGNAVGIFATYDAGSGAAGTAVWYKQSYSTMPIAPSLMTNCAGTSLALSVTLGGTPLLVIVDNGANGLNPNVKARLNQVVTATRPGASPLAATCFPNPAHSTVQVSLPAAAAQGLRAEVLNGLGQRVRQQEFPALTAGATVTLNVGQLPAGLYTLRLTAGQQNRTQPLAIE